MFKDIKNILLLALAVVIAFLLLQIGCGNGVDVPSKPKSDTVSVYDTIWAKDTVIAFKPIYKPKYDTIYKIDTLKYNVDPWDLFFVREYQDTLIDSNLEVYTYAKALGILDSINVKYKLKVPVIMTEHHTITNTVTETKIPKFSIYAGLEAGGNTSTFNLSPIITLNIKNNNISYRYGLLDQTHNVGVGIKLFKSRK